MFYFLQRSSSSAAKCLDKQDSCSCVIVPRETAESISQLQLAPESYATWVVVDTQAPCAEIIEADLQNRSGIVRSLTLSVTAHQWRV